jgi:hypothetical protein
MPESYDLNHLDPYAFEHLVNLLALRVLGPGHTGFCPGSDGGRDGYFEGEAPYPSETERWSGRWYIQSKFHKPNASKDPQKWLLSQIKKEIAEFKKVESRRILPDNWIIATNIDPSGVPQTGSFDKARELVAKDFPQLDNRFHIWGGQKILDLLTHNPNVVKQYSHFITPGNILAEIYDQIKDSQPEVKTILRFLILSQLDEQQYTKLEQAGSAADTRPGIHNLFIDLPFGNDEYEVQGLVTDWLTRTSAKCHQIDDDEVDLEAWRAWNRNPSRARVWFIKGGPGQGKSTIGQYFCQVQRAALITQKHIQSVPAPKKALANEIRKVAEKAGFWTLSPRIPLYIELKDFAHWYGQQDKSEPRGILTYVAKYISVGVEQNVSVGTLKRLLGTHRWFIVFDGLDEVPQDVKHSVALEVCHFVNNVAIEANSDLLTICTSRPQGYSGQFSNLDGPIIELLNLSPEQALACAKPVVELDRSASESKKSMQILASAIQSPAVRELMTTPLQSHIMAVVVRDGERPPERRWKLFTNFYQVIKKREANRDLPDKKIAKLLREDEKLLRTVHNRLGFVLHAQAESSQGAQTRLDRDEFKVLVHNAVAQMVETGINEQVKVLMEATTDRLVLVSTPDDGNYVRFDVRQLQEFFAAEFIYESASVDELRERLQIISGDAHWREVTHFLLSALIENDRKTELTVAIQVLENLNEGDEESLRLLNQKLGRGAILVARLLQEGVLEQDKRIRQQFRNSLKPLITLTDGKLLFPLTQVNQSNSKSWLYGFLVSCLQENNLNESIGAAIVLVQVLPDDHEYIEDVNRFLTEASSEYLSCLLTSSLLQQGLQLERHRPNSSSPIKKWFLRSVAKIILGTQWISLSKNAFKIILRIIISQHKDFLCICDEFDLKSIDLKIINSFVSDHTPSLSKVEEDYGFIKIFYSDEDYFIDIFSDEELSEDFSKSCNFVQIIKLIFCFIKSNSYSDLSKIMHWCNEKNLDFVNLFFNQLNLYIPLDLENLLSKKSLIHSQDLIDKNYNKLIKRTKARFVYSLSEIDPHLSLKRLFKNYSDLAIQAWSTEEISHRMFVESQVDEITNLCIEKFIETPDLFIHKAFVWGRLIKQDRSSDNIVRKTILSNIENNIFYQEDSISTFYPFMLNLPSEAPLIPHLLNSIISTQRVFLPYRDQVRRYELIKDIIIEMFPETTCLRQIYENISLDSQIRASAIIILLLHPYSDEKIENLKEKLVEFYSSTVESWYIKSLSAYLILLASEKDPVVQWIMNKLIDVTRGDYESKKYLESVLELWRENSQAPISNAGVQTKWLNGES